MVFVEALALSRCAKAFSGTAIGTQASVSHTDGRRMWALWLHPWVTTDPARAFSWSGRGATEVQGAQSAQPCTQLAEGTREGLGVMHKALLLVARIQNPAPELGLRALMTEAAE